MLVKEMHIMFEQGVQKLGSLSRRKFYPQEIDSYLNRATEQFIRDSIRVEEDGHGFQKVQVDLDRIRPLVQRRTFINTQYIESTKTYREYKLSLPGDYSYLVSDMWYHAPVCSTNTSASVPMYAYAVPIANSPLGAAPYYATVKLEMTNGTLTDTLVNLTSDIPSSLYTGFNNIAEKFVLPKLIQEIFNQKNNNGDFTSLSYNVLGVYFERFGNLYYPNQLIVVTDQSTYYPKITIDSSVVTVSSATKNLSYTQDSESEYDLDTSRLIKASALDQVLTTEYYKPLKTSPVTTIDRDTMRVYSHPNRIVNKGALTYIRQPQKINLILQRNSDLAPEFHQKIVDMAVEYAAGRLEQAGLYQIARDENGRNP